MANVEPWRETRAYEAGAAGGRGGAAWSSSNSGQYVDPGAEARPYEAGAAGGGGSAAAGSSSHSGQYVEPRGEATPAYAAGSAGGGINIDDATRLLLRVNAEVFYRRSAEMKAAMEEGFMEADEGRRGRVTLAELLKACGTLPEGCNPDAVSKLFRFLDGPFPTGSLTFPDYCVILHHIVGPGLRVCSFCASPILLMLGFTCRTCWEEGSPSSFDLCVPCFSSRSFPAFVEYGLIYTVMLNKTKAINAPISTNTNVAPAPPRLQTHEELQLFYMRLQQERQMAHMLANSIANVGAAVNALVPDTHTYTYI
ncbi:hypothetical protein GOP47_0008090 [Adiantum capillus-veneris]|uniref:EF-hand domain-containing protein n=1 Tax=Adiantum capillus-veneris TaxID=13818 RepID=A0A9D4UY99_ADICA|nr:hypothetical protein GOP47_0008090 [Adiantum capillus-veneris]